MNRLTQIAAATALAISAAACGGSSDTQSVVAPSGTVVTETFSGTAPVGGAQDTLHAFTVAVAGTINITLISAGPPSTITMGLALGNPSGSTCAIISGDGIQTVAGSTAQLSGSIAAGAYCVVVIDVGNAAQPVSYTVSVAHT